MFQRFRIDTSKRSKSSNDSSKDKLTKTASFHDVRRRKRDLNLYDDDENDNCDEIFSSRKRVTKCYIQN